MRKEMAEYLVTRLSNNLSFSDEFKLRERIQSFPLQGFHDFANGKDCIGAFKIKSKTSREKL